MKKLVLASAVLGFVGMTSAAMAAPEVMNDAQMDAVTAGTLMNIALVDLVDINTAVVTQSNVVGVAGAGVLQANASAITQSIVSTNAVSFF